MRNLIAAALFAGLSLSAASAATYRISASPSEQVERVESATYQMAPTSTSRSFFIQAPMDDVELAPTRGSNMAPLNSLYLNLSEYPGEQNPYIHPEGTRWPYPMSAPTYDGHFHLPGGQW